MYKHLPAILIVCGVVLMAGSFLFGATNALPYPDPTAEQLALQASKANMFKLAFFIGVMDVVSGLCLLWVRANKRRKASGSQTSSKF